MSISTPRRHFGVLSLLGGVGAAASLAALASSMLPAGAAMAQVGSAPARDADPALVAEGLFAAGNATRLAAAAWFEARGTTDGVAALIRALRFNRSGASRDASSNAAGRIRLPATPPRQNNGNVIHLRREPWPAATRCRIRSDW